MSILDRARELRKVIEANAETMSDDRALENPELFPTWREGVDYSAGQRVRYGGALYKVNDGQGHTSQSGWTPDAAPSLFSKVLIPDDTVIPAWEQPDSTNGYSYGNKVTHNGKTWMNILEDVPNTWEPGVYGWTEL